MRRYNLWLPEQFSLSSHFLHVGREKVPRFEFGKAWSGERDRPVIVVVSGLLKEASIAAGPGILPVLGGGSRKALQQRLAAVDIGSCQAVVSFGIAGALERDREVGHVVLATEVIDADTRYATSAKLRRSWLQRLQPDKVASSEVSIAGVDAPLLTATDKAALRTATGAGAVDMESHIAAAWAAEHGLPFAVLRVISDSSEHTLPPAAGAAMRPDGSVDVLGVMRSLVRDPAQIPALVATARDAAVAFRQLRRVRRLLDLGGGLVGLDL